MKSYKELTAPQLMKFDILMKYHLRYDITKSTDRIADCIKGKTINADKIEKTWAAMVETYQDAMKINDYGAHVCYIKGLKDIVEFNINHNQDIELDIPGFGSFAGRASAKVIKEKTVCWFKIDNQDLFEFPDKCFFIEDLIN
jgi:hypothetical protein